MKQIGNWHVGFLPDKRKRALHRNADGECIAVIQPAGSGPFVVVRFVCTAEAYKGLVESDGDFNDPALAGVEIKDAIQVPDGLVDALLA